MSVLVKGMEMPKSCFECPFMLHRCFCLVNPRIEFTDEEYSELKGRYSGCPLVPVPPHGRLIDADVLCNRLEIASRTSYEMREEIEYVAKWIVKYVPTVIPASESKERPAFLPQYELTPRSEEG